jgi:hypothetical protein
MRLAQIALISTFLALTSCSENEATLKNINEPKAVELAKTEFARTGHHLEDYRVTIDSDSSGKKWIVWFVTKSEPPVPGGKHAVTVEKETGKVSFMPGE